MRNTKGETMSGKLKVRTAILTVSRANTTNLDAKIMSIQDLNAVVDGIVAEGYILVTSYLVENTIEGHTMAYVFALKE